ncbi:MAG: zinc transport system permease protein [Parcubacteria group bacterium LiPW_41]|nr:MAG: zinc transport system permease protein [Parcubacteria group bacterium LiPW_41]
MTIPFIVFVSGVVIAAASGLVGSLLTLRKMTLLSDALSHIALPGIALGILFHFTPIWGGIVFLFLGVFLIWAIEARTKLATESITGVLFVTALAIGALLIPEEELLETFFGNVQSISYPAAYIQMMVAILIIGVTLSFLKHLTLTSIAPDLATASKISKKSIEILLLVLIATTIAVGISFVGVLLMSSLLIVPAVTAKNLAKTFKGFIGISMGISAFSLFLGLCVASVYSINPGLATVLISSGIFFASLLVPTK